MNPKVLLFLVPASLALLTPTRASAYVGFRLNLAVPLYYPAYGPYYPVATYDRPVAYQAPTRVEGEQMTPAPGAGYVWISGHWSNNAQRWVWLAGHWELPPSPSATWVPGHWAQSNGGWVWVNDTWAVGDASASQPQLPPTPPVANAAAGPQSAMPAAQPAMPAAAPAPSSPPPAVEEMADGTVVASEPPAPIVEYIPACPYPDYIWLGGYWGWHGGWYWNPGHYAPRPFHGAAWISGGWGRIGAGWAWRGGHWR